MFVDDAATQLETDSVCVLGTDLFISSQVDIPMLASGEATVQLIPTSGSGPDWIQNDTIRPAYLNPGMQVTVRADTFDVAFQKATDVYNSLVAVRNRFISNVFYMWIKALQEPRDAGADLRGQATVQFNMIAKRQPNSNRLMIWKIAGGFEVVTNQTRVQDGIVMRIDGDLENGSLLFGGVKPFIGLVIEMETPNTDPAVLDTNYNIWDPVTPLPNFVDGTDLAGATFGQDGNMTWDLPSPWEARSLSRFYEDGLPGSVDTFYWVEFRVFPALSALSAIKSITPIFP